MAATGACSADAVGDAEACIDTVGNGGVDGLSAVASGGDVKDGGRADGEIVPLCSALGDCDPVTASDDETLLIGTALHRVTCSSKQPTSERARDRNAFRGLCESRLIARSAVAL